MCLDDLDHGVDVLICEQEDELVRRHDPQAATHRPFGEVPDVGRGEQRRICQQSGSQDVAVVEVGQVLPIDETLVAGDGRVRAGRSS